MLFQPSGPDLYGIDARSGRQLSKHTVAKGGSIRSSPMTYQAAGRQHVALVAGNTVVALALPPAQ